MDSFSYKNGRLFAEGVDVELFVAWKDNKMVFKNEKLEDLVLKLERWYDVEINGIPAQFPASFKPQFNEDGSIDVFHADGTKLASKSEGSLVFWQRYQVLWHDKWPIFMPDFWQ